MIVLSLLKERNFKQLVLAGCAYATGRQKEEDGKRFCVTNATGILPACSLGYLFNISVFKSPFKQHYCYARHTSTTVFFPLLSCCVTSFKQLTSQKHFCMHL